MTVDDVISSTIESIIGQKFEHCGIVNFRA